MLARVPGYGRPSASQWRTGPAQTSQRGRARRLRQRAVARPEQAGRCPCVAVVGRLVGDVDDAFHAERGVLAVVLGVKQAGQYPEAGPDVDDLLLEGAVGQDVDEGVEADGELLCLAVLARFQQLGDLLCARQAGPRAATIMWTKNPSLPKRTRSPLCRVPGPRKLNSIEDILACGAGSLAGEAALVMLNVVNVV